MNRRLLILAVSCTVALTRLACAGAGNSPTYLIGAMDDLRSLACDTNAGRLAALKEMLYVRGIRYTVEEVRPPTAFVIPQPRSGHNVVVTLGDGPEDIVVCAHWDAAELPGRTLSKGAVDNGAAVVAMVRVAETLAREKLNSRVRILFTDKEEAQARGLNRFVWAHRNDPVKAAVIVDLVAAGNSVYYHDAAPPPPASEAESGFPQERSRVRRR